MNLRMYISFDVVCESISKTDHVPFSVNYIPGDPPIRRLPERNAPKSRRVVAFVAYRIFHNPTRNNSIAKPILL